jgi:hypothetical protein
MLTATFMPKAVGAILPQAEPSLPVARKNFSVAQREASRASTFAPSELTLAGTLMRGPGMHAGSLQPPLVISYAGSSPLYDVLLSSYAHRVSGFVHFSLVTPPCLPARPCPHRNSFKQLGTV